MTLNSCVAITSRLQRFFISFILVLAAIPTVYAEDSWRLALPGWRYEFPRDHFAHADFKTEWWYFTGNLRDESGRRYGYQLTFFRQGIRPFATRGQTKSRFICNELKFAHFAVSDPAGKRFLFTQKTSRGAFDEAGFAKSERIAWIDEWSLAPQPDGSMKFSAAMNGASISLTAKPEKPWVLHGVNGVSQKADGEGHASHYYSGTRLTTRGNLTLSGRELNVTGTSWFDQEWATNQLTLQQVGWNWFSLHLADGTELMLYQMRLRDGSLDPNSSGTFIARDGIAQHLRRDDYKLTPTRWWTSDVTKARYPVAWQLRIPSLNIEAEVTTPLDKQELELPPIAYWEGMIDFSGTRAGQPIYGEGYMELTGYAGPLGGLSKTQ
ncbi:MAG TPA: lipocalin-like domain-containing protein [Chthoniobacteraceae bacterium]|nr:lipocalin-like domain-containing protein [Chthoniobacteraceae bacterium]